ncbi:hypothetical protein SAMN05216275_14151 [Streptosporangium canum]|uniref:Uncharacterized protein n=1 Tax=Streptosporangium canum TaxID=324952 RepID=A0A1I4DFX3_9ACTN|nr:hypothetical protein [Streptosporangium canum]SFK92382.1 hypothetical protein SAMN05216275_14151 [Streptosporangium canum]
MIDRTIRATATDPKAGMTLAELAAFVQAALREDAADDVPVKAIVNMRGGIKKLETRA